MVLQKAIAENGQEFIALCQKHKVRKVYGFGSSVAGGFNNQASDIDLLVEMDITDPVEKGQQLLSFWDALESFFQRRVDLVTEESIKNPFLRENIYRTRTLIYDRTGEKVFS